MNVVCAGCKVVASFGGQVYAFGWPVRVLLQSESEGRTGDR